MATDEILGTHRFTNAYRAADRVRQYMIWSVAYDRLRVRAVLLVCWVLAVAPNFLWVTTQRTDRPLDIDEAGYASISFIDYRALRSSGITAWVRQIVEQGVQAPLAPAIASMIDRVTGWRMDNVFVVSVLAYGAILWLTWMLTSRSRPLTRALVMLFVATSPVLLNYSRSFNFAELASACLVAVLYFGSRKDAFSRVWPSCAWGVCLGLMLLARTMTVAFVPGIFLAACLPVIARKSVKGALYICLGTGVGALVAAIWYVKNLAGVVSYLTNFGYGSNAAAYGPARSVLSLHAWYLFLLGLVQAYLYLADGLFLGLGLLALGGVVVMRSRSSGASGGFVMWLASVRRIVADNPTWLACGVVGLAGLAALMSSRNQGSAFVAPLVVPLTVAAAYGFTGFISSRRRRRSPRILAVLAWAVVTILGSMALAASVTTFLPFSDTVTVTIDAPGGTPIHVVDSRSTLFSYEQAGLSPKTASGAYGTAWLSAWAWTQAQLQRFISPAPYSVLVLTFGDRLLNINTIELQSLMTTHYETPIVAMNQLPAGSSATTYFAQVQRVARYVRVVGTITPNSDVFSRVPTGISDAYLDTLHFREFASHRLPDGAVLALWTRPTM